MYWCEGENSKLCFGSLLETLIILRFVFSNCDVLVKVLY